MAGLDTTGFSIKSAEDIRTAVNTAQQAAFGPQVDTTDGSILGQLTAIQVSLIAELWELAQAVNASLDPDAATGAQLDQVCALTGVTRLPAKASTTTLTLTGTNATTVTAGAQVSVTGSGAIFTTDTTVVLATLTAWTTTHAYVIGDRRTNASRSYVCTTAGTSAGSGGPTTTSSAITDGSVIWKYIGEGAAAVDVAATAAQTGAIVVVASAIVTIQTPVSGWSSVRNLYDDALHASTGRDVESDQDLRVRRLDELAASGSAPIDALRADLLNVENVTSVTVFENVTDVVDLFSTPAHGVQCLIQGGTSQDIFDQLLASVAAGIAIYGTTSGTAVDAVGTSHTVAFTRPSAVRTYVAITLTYDAASYPIGGDAAVKAALVAYVQGFKSGKDVTSSGISATCFKVAGVLDVVHAYIGTAPAPGSTTTIAIDLLSLATLSTGDISVSSSAATP